MSISSAPGKLMLFGEHAVVYGYPCLVTAVDVRYSVSVEIIEEPIISIRTPSLDVKNEIIKIKVEDLQKSPLTQEDSKFVIAVLQDLYSRSGFQKGLTVETYGPETSYGLGSSSAISVATAHAFSNLMSITITKNELFETAYTAVLKIQKTGSGFDVAAATYGGTLRYQIDQPIEVLETGNLPLVIGFTGVKVSTVDQINKVKVLKDQYPVIIDHQFQTVGKITEKSCQALIDQDWVNLGKLANINQGINQSLDISSPALDKAILAARDAGAYGAKLSGAGGGDCMFAISDNSKAIYIEEALKVAGTQVLHFKTNCEGVRLEKDLSE